MGDILLSYTNSVLLFKTPVSAENNTNTSQASNLHAENNPFPYHDQVADSMDINKQL